MRRDGFSPAPSTGHEWAKRQCRLLRFLISGTILNLGGAVFAQTTPPGSAEPPVIAVQATQQQAARSNPQISLSGGLDPLPCPLKEPRFASVSIRVAEIAFDGPQGFDSSILRPAYDGLMNREVPISSLCDIRDSATALLRQRGYVADVRLPPQDPINGRVRMRLVLGRLTALEVRGDAGRAERQIAAYLRPLQGMILNLEEAEKRLQLIDNLPGYDVRLSLRPIARGEEGDLAGVVTVRFRSVIASVNVNNFDESLPILGVGRVDVNGLTGLADRTTIGFLSTPDARQLRGFLFGHRFFVSDGVEIGARITHVTTRNDLDDQISIDTRSWLGTADIGFPVRLASIDQLRANVGLEYFGYRVRLGGIPLVRDELRILFLRLQFGRPLSDYGVNRGALGSDPLEFDATIELRKGLSVLGASESCGPALERCLSRASFPSRIDGDPTATVLRASGRVRYHLTNRLSLRLAGIGQYTDSPLQAFEEFVGGNFTIGRGFGASALRGDRAVALTSEVQYGGPVAREFALDVHAYMFVDAVRHINLDPIAPSSNTAISVGGGFRAILARRLTAEIFGAVPVSEKLFGVERDPQIIGSLTLHFST